MKTELLATIAELVDGNTRLHMELNKRKGAKSPKPLSIPRPWQKPRVKRRATPKETRAMFGAIVNASPREE